MPSACFGPHRDDQSTYEETSNFFQNVHKSEVKCNHKDNPQSVAKYNKTVADFEWMSLKIIS